MGGKDVASLVLLSVGAVVMFFPLYWMFATAVRPRNELFDEGFDLWPSQLAWSNFAEAWNSLPFALFYVNSFAIAIIAVVVTVFINLLVRLHLRQVPSSPGATSSSCSSSARS